MKFGIWNVGILYRAGSLTAAARELARYKLKSWLKVVVKILVIINQYFNNRRGQ
jgi:hypothetical protein